MAANHPSISVPLTFVLYIICYTFSGNPSIFPLQCIQTTHHVQTTGENEIQCENVNNHGKWAMTGEWTWWYRWGIYFEHIWTRSDYWAEKGGGGEKERERKESVVGAELFWLHNNSLCSSFWSSFVHSEFSLGHFAFMQIQVCRNTQEKKNSMQQIKEHTHTRTHAHTHTHTHTCIKGECLKMWEIFENVRNKVKIDKTWKRVREVSKNRREKWQTDVNNQE